MIYYVVVWWQEGGHKIYGKMDLTTALSVVILARKMGHQAKIVREVY